MPFDPSGEIEKARSLLQHAHFVVAFTGAGISTPSGIPDFRSQRSGLWNTFDPMEVASLTAFQMTPKKFWDWKRPLMRQIWSAAPNAAHTALAQLENRGVLKTIITQNIDGLHQRAGSHSVLELHGSIETMTCPACQTRVRSADFRVLIETTEEIPLCASCGAILKPDVVLYEEPLPQDTWYTADSACASADLILVIGSSLEVWPAASLPQMAVENGAHLIIANYSPTPLDARADAILSQDVAQSLPLLVGV